jgi:hypothetical protein
MTGPVGYDGYTTSKISTVGYILITGGAAGKHLQGRSVRDPAKIFVTSKFS